MRMELPALGTDLAKALDESVRCELQTALERGVYSTLAWWPWSRMHRIVGPDSIRSSLLPSMLARLDWRP